MSPEPEEPEPQHPKPDRTLLAILAAIAVLVIAGDETAAAAYLSDAARNKCNALERSAVDKLRVTLVSTTERATSADVKVLITVSENAGPFGSNEYQVEDVFDLVKMGDKWLINNAPWQLRVCHVQPVKQ
ncbi:hypothetical protein [Pseudarthrobacter sp. S9]|uniref:hypothetical protein n=1 Tax=Pseudarthrobacter sp. S9 TaxID=3418421 RepID=UPI003D043493